MAVEERYVPYTIYPETYFVFTAISDDVPPEVGNFSPANGSTVTATDPVFFEVTDNQADFRRVIVLCEQDGITEVVHNGDEFLYPYDALSSRSNIANGWEYSVRRELGWVSNVTITVYAIDAEGNENAD